MFPGRRVVAGPHGRIALHASVTGAREHERTLLRAQFVQAVECRTRHLHAVDVVVARVGAGMAVAVVLRVERKSLAWIMHERGLFAIRWNEYAGLVHVVPKAVDPLIEKARIQRAEPGA